MELQLCLAAALAGTLSFVPVHEAISLEALNVFGLILFATLALRTVYWVWIYPYYVSPLRHLPGPKDHHFLVGQVLRQFMSGNPNEPYVSWVRKWPEADMIRYFSVGNSESILVTGLDVFREVLSVKTYSFVKPSVFTKLLEPIVGRGLVFSEGEEHKRQRRLLAGPFSLTKLRRLIPVFQQAARKLSDYFDKQIESEGGAVELVGTYSSVTLDIIGVAALGVQFQNLDAPTPFHECYHRVFDPPLLGQVLMTINAFIPVRRIPLRENREFLEANAEVHRLVREIVRERLEEIAARGDAHSSHDGGRRDLLTYIIEETYGTENAWTEDQLLDHMLTMIAAGHETTASALLWATYALIKHQDVQKRLRAEVLEMLKETPVPGYAKIERLQYLNNFCKEVLRLYCPAISSPRCAAEDVTIRGLRIPKGTTMMIMPQAIQLNPRIFGDDVDCFNPDRWTRQSLDAHAFAAFLHGPRQCIGRVFSMLEFKIILIEIISKFSFDSLETDEVVLINPSPLLRPKGGMKVKVSRLA